MDVYKLPLLKSTEQYHRLLQVCASPGLAPWNPRPRALLLSGVLTGCVIGTNLPSRQLPGTYSYCVRRLHCTLATRTCCHAIMQCRWTHVLDPLLAVLHRLLSRCQRRSMAARSWWRQRLSAPSTTGLQILLGLCLRHPWAGVLPKVPANPWRILRPLKPSESRNLLCMLALPEATLSELSLIAYNHRSHNSAMLLTQLISLPDASDIMQEWRWAWRYSSALALQH